MAWSLQCLLVALFAFAAVTSAATVTLDWNITWVRANPDGMAERPVMGINGQWPLPLLNFTKGDRVIANVHNQVR
jgi:iron transport multicopper oxidase